MRDPKIDPRVGDVVEDGTWRYEVVHVVRRTVRERKAGKGSWLAYTKRLSHETPAQADRFDVGLGSWRGRWAS